MILRSIFSRVNKSQFLNNFCSQATVNSIHLDSETAWKPFSSLKKVPKKLIVISYLINSCGLSSENAISASEKVHFDSTGRPDAVLSFLAEHGFSKSQISEIVRKRPVILLSNPEKAILPKIEFFLQSTGLAKTDILRAIARDPTFLTRSVENHLKPIFNYLKDILGAEKVDSLLRRGAWIFHRAIGKTIISNVDYLLALEVPNSFLASGLSSFPQALIQNHDQFRKNVADVKEMGFDPSKSKFVLALHVRSGGNKALWANCYETYRKWGWSKDDIYMAFKIYPLCMLLSKKKLSAVLSFLVTKMGCESRMISQYPHVFSYSLEKRIIPRCSVVRLLSSKGLVSKDKSLYTILCSSEKYFLDTFVTKYAHEVHQLYDIYKGKDGIAEV